MADYVPLPMDRAEAARLDALGPIGEAFRILNEELRVPTTPNEELIACQGQLQAIAARYLGVRSEDALPGSTVETEMKELHEKIMEQIPLLKADQHGYKLARSVATSFETARSSVYKTLHWDHRSPPGFCCCAKKTDWYYLSKRATTEINAQVARLQSQKIIRKKNGF